jgi:PKD repeat protein
MKTKYLFSLSFLSLLILSRTAVAQTTLSFPAQNEDQVGLYSPGANGSLSYFSSSAVEDPEVNFTASADTICVGDVVHFTDLSANGPSTWNWNFNGGSPATSTVQNPSVIYNLPGKYNVILNVGNSSGSHVKGVLSMIIVMECTGLQEYYEGSNFQIFPNPAQSFVNIVSQLKGSYTLSSLTGAQLASGAINEKETVQLSLNDIAPGIYLLSVQNSRGTKTIKFIKE